MTVGIKVTKTQSEPSSSDFPMGKISSVTASDSLKECPLRFVSHVQLEAARARIARPQFASCLFFEKDCAVTTSCKPYV